MTKKLPFEDVIDLLGGFGFYQKRLYVLSILPAIFVAIMTFIVVFTIDEQKHRCRMYNFQNETDSYGSVQYEVYKNESQMSLLDDTCHVRTNETSNQTKECSEWVYDTSVHEKTLVSEFDLVCSRTILQSHASMGMFAGELVAAAFFGLIGDRYGRKLAICLSITLMIIGHLGTAFIPNYYSFIILRVIGGLGNIGYWNSAVILGFEIAGPKKRLWTGMIIEIIWCFGEYLTVFVAYFVRDWRTLQLIFAAPAVLFLIYWKALSESPRWLVNKGRVKDAKKILRDIGRTNGRDISQLDDIEIIADSKTKGSIIKTTKTMMTSGTMIIRCLILLLNWITVHMGYHGLTLNSGSIGGNVYVNFSISVTMELIGYTLCIIFLDRIGRRTFHSTAMLVGGVSCLCSIFPVMYGNQSHQWIIITLSMIGKLGISATFGDIYFLSAELFPTSVRNLVLGVSTIFGHTGSLAAPYIADLGLLVTSTFGKALPLVIFGSFMVASGILSFFLPETMNQHMPETVEEAIALKKRNEKQDKYNMDVCVELTKENNNE